MEFFVPQAFDLVLVDSVEFVDSDVLEFIHEVLFVFFGFDFVGCDAHNQKWNITFVLYLEKGMLVVAFSFTGLADAKPLALDASVEWRL